MRRSSLPSLFLLLSVMTIGAFMLEGFARWKIGTPRPERLPLVRVKPDRNIGWVMVPGDVHYTYDKKVRLNNYGFRGTNIQRIKPENEYRIIALGDSHIYGQGLADESLLTTVLQNSLNKLGHGHFYRVINTGVRGYSINNELAVLKKIVIPLNPDHVILFFYLNDFHKTNIGEWYDRFKDKDWYVFDLSDKPTNQIIRKWKLVQILRKSSFLMYVNDTYFKITNNNNFENRILQGVIDSAFKQNLQFVKDSLDELIRMSNKYNFSLTLAVLPVAAQAMNDYPNELYQSTLRQYAEHNSLDFVDLLPSLRSCYEQYDKKLVIPFDGHYNAKAHKAFGMTMTEHLSGLIMN
jgi:lysophospholipase L1-like esterase